MPFFDKRGSGLLLHITSLPSKFGIGDLGPEAKAFTEMLYRTRQQYWQILPINPVQEETAFSPYSSTSSLAGNPWLISPELLHEQGLLTKAQLKSFELPSSDKVSFVTALANKEKILETAFAGSSQKKEPYEAFCHREAHWLDDFALYVALKDHFKKPWYGWPAKYKLRDLKTMMKFTAEHEDAIDYIKWLQYQFFRQWKDFRGYCNDLNIKLIGDLPFYVNYDSVDVWSKKEIFSLDDEGKMKSMAGVPPDYFNADGQLWGMPIYCWDVLKEQHYDWWVKRIKKNFECVDVLRLDHFRAFAGYWDVPAKEKTARHGSWKKGPGEDLFIVLKQKFGTLPFIAEDLGEITADVHELRDKFGLPGMKVLQFAFGENIASNEHSPHNYGQQFIGYTGTHDNNTTVGWYRKELDKAFKEQVQQYAGMAIDAANVHQVFARVIQASVCISAIIPVQDILGLDEQSRMNIPASTEGNWSWRLMPGQITEQHEAMLKGWTVLYNRS